jgi:uncharacterized protein
MEMRNADYWINRLNLQEHPEGGYYREVFASSEIISQKCLPNRFEGERTIYTSIYFLLKNDQVSHMHLIKSDEIWCFHTGNPLNIHIIDENGNYSIKKLGLNFKEGELPQQIVKAGSWFGANFSDISEFALVGCIVAPGFNFTDFELAKREDLIELYPEQQQIITFLTA